MSKDATTAEVVKHRARQSNRAAILDFARRAATFSRAQLVAATGLSPATVTRVVRTLIAEGYLVDAGEVRSSGGRPQIMLSYRPETELVAVIDVHDGIIEASLLDWTGQTHGESERRTTADFSQNAASVLDLFIGRVGARLKAVAVAIPGVTADADGRIRLAPSIGQPIAHLKHVLESRFDLPVVVDNDVNLMVVGEHVAGAAIDTDDVMLMHIGETGIGAALMMNGAVRQGASGSAGEIGFLPFGRPRPAGDEMGAFEAEWALARVRERMSSVAGEVPERVPKAALRAWGRAAAAAVCVVDPEVLLVSGPNLGTGDLTVLVDEAERYVPGETDIRLAAIGPRALLIGGARRAFDAYDALEIT